jgi:hypothetical protein
MEIHGNIHVFKISSTVYNVIQYRRRQLIVISLFPFLSTFHKLKRTALVMLCNTLWSMPFFQFSSLQILFEPFFTLISI